MIIVVFASCQLDCGSARRDHRGGSAALIGELPLVIGDDDEPRLVQEFSRDGVRETLPEPSCIPVDLKYFRTRAPSPRRHRGRLTEGW